MELWENEVYRFKTIGQLKVVEGQILKFCVFVVRVALSLILSPLSVISGHQSVFAQRRSASQAGNL